jgi:pimeloyl-ACP methyl ester carboxylesterase
MDVVDVGQGRATLLLHGLPSPREDLLALCNALPGRRLIAPWLPGYGSSPALPGSSFAEVERVLLRMLGGRGIGSIDIVGFSAGGYRALSLALSGAIEVRSLVLLGAFADLSAENRAGMRGFAGALRAAVDLHDAVPPRYLSAEGVKRAEWVARARSWLDVVPAHVMAEELLAVADVPSLLPRLGELSVALVARTGAEDQAIPLASAEAIVAGVRGAVLEAVPGVGHALPIEDFEGTAASIRRALAG